MKTIQMKDIDGFFIGHSQDEENGTGCSVILCPEGATAGVDVRGGGPATRETDLLNPKNMVQKIHAVTLSGGSAFGLEASSGVMEYLSEQEIGFELKGIYIPIVCQASLFDCGVANAKAYPNKAMGYQACMDAMHHNEMQGNIGAGMGASVGKAFGFEHAMKTGLGHCAFQVGELQVGAIVALNACGDIYDPDTNTLLAGAYDYNQGSFMKTEERLIEMASGMQTSGHENTTIGCIVTNADLDKSQMNKVASMAHNGYARCIRPVHTSSDGDTIFAMSTNKVEANTDVVGILAVKAMEQAILHATKESTSAYHLYSHSSL